MASLYASSTAEGFVRSLSIIIARVGGRVGDKAFSNDEMLEKLKWIKGSLKEWHACHAKNIVGKILMAKDRLNELDLKGEESMLSVEEVKERTEISAHMFSLSRVECSISWQNSRTKWLMEGDVNSKFFHALANSRGRKKLIVILDVNGEQVEGVQDIQTTIFDHFSNHFKSSRISRPGVGNLEFKSISGVEANMLVASFGEEEVRQAVWLSKVIGSVISDNQSDFVQGRQILDGIIIANEVVDEAKSKKKELLMFKVDFEKAYDSVEWSYLLFVMHKMNFPLKWRRWISECIRSASTSVLVNGSPTEEFFFERGLRQGDPLSPFLFLIAAEGLQAMLKASVHAALFSGF
ncbi:hypothetical protein TSUD_372250 [Trifolium subterraneum]|uniref:Reverse transcriptase domain-containing protein n=1 Tax=Trifolium subterraneum TaxID=3900 RepID=A0A2Z6MDY5_TRISU|nr:hypothetical protein TSUD_372250 [Trifolium subterraneum]